VAGERIGELFEQHGRMVYGVCRLILRDPTEAEDAAQQTFLSAYRGLLSGQEPREPSAWLGTIARNECRGRLRSRQTEPLTLVTEPSGDETQREVGRRAEADAISAALSELPQQQRDAILLREFYGLSYSEVAAALGLSGAAVESLIFRSRKRLQDQLRPLRAALGALVVPLSLRDSLADALPGFGAGGAGAGAGAGAAALAKLGSTSIAAKLAAGALAVGTVGTVAGIEQHRVRRHSTKPAKPVVAVKALEHPTAQPALSAPPPPRSEPVRLVTRTRSVGSGDSSSRGGTSSNEADRTQTETDQSQTPTEKQRPSGDGERGGGGSSGGGSDSGSLDDGGDSSGSGSGSGDGSGDSSSGSGDSSGDSLNGD